MTQLLIRLFVRHPDDTKNAAVRTAYGNLASLVGMACNLLLCLGKLAAGTLFGSIAIMADALNNLSDASSNVVSLVGFRLAAKGPDEKHPYGPRPVRISGGPCGLRHHPRHRPVPAERICAQSAAPDGSGVQLAQCGGAGGVHRRQALDEPLQQDHRPAHQLRDPDGHRRRQPERRADHQRRASVHRPLPPDGLGRAGRPHGRGSGGVHPLVGLGAYDGHPQPSAGRKPLAGAGGAHRAHRHERTRGCWASTI